MPQPFHAGGAAARPLSGLTNHSLQFIQDLFANTLELDINRVSSVLTIIGFASRATRYATSALNWVSSWCQQFFTACVTVAAKEELHDQILDWLSVHVIEPQGTRLLTARVTTSKNGKPIAVPPSDTTGRRRAPIEYLPAFGITWFFYERRLFAVMRSKGTTTSAARALGVQHYPPGAMMSESKKEDERISILCIGRSTEPIKRLFETCRDYADKKSESLVTVRGCRGSGYRWEIKAQKPIRRIETVHFDARAKTALVDDIRKYLDPRTQRYYIRRGIPYRRGYLMYGPPGTGKTSLSLALAGMFGLDLYVLEMSSVYSDSMLEQLFTQLPPYCIVLLEDIDAVGIKREHEEEDEDTENEKDKEKQSKSVSRARANPTAPSSKCTLSGLLNVLDGVASQEGRIILMTSNMPEKLDEALLRPGRIDQKVHLGHINQSGAEQMFRRMFEPDPPEEPSEESPDEVGDGKEHRPTVEREELEHEDLDKAALKFASHIPENVVTPAQVQEFLLQRHDSPTRAVDEISDWIIEQIGRTGEGKPSDAENKESEDITGKQQTNNVDKRVNGISGEASIEK